MFNSVNVLKLAVRFLKYRIIMKYINYNRIHEVMGLATTDPGIRETVPDFEKESKKIVVLAQSTIAKSLGVLCAPS
jgi:hypothetical protein